MADANLIWSGDLAFGPGGDLSMVDGALLTQQRVLRRLLSNEFADIWHSKYGAGLGQFVGRAFSAREIEGVIRSQIHLENSVRRQPEAVVTTDQLPDGGVFVDIVYADATAAAVQVLTFSVGS